MLEIAKDSSITLSKGDSCTVNFNFSGVLPTTSDNVYFTIRDKAESTGTEKLTKQLTYVDEDTFKLSLTAAETGALSAGTYWWDIGVYYSDDSVAHPLRPKKLTIVDTVTTGA